MKTSAFMKSLKRKGAIIENGKKHYKVYLNGKKTTVPRHKGQEINEGLRINILRQLGLRN